MGWTPKILPLAQKMRVLLLLRRPPPTSLPSQLLQKTDSFQPSLPTTAVPLLQGACGYGSIPKDQYPYFSVAALSPSNQFYKAGPLNGCGECFQVQCTGPSACNKDANGQPMSVVVMIAGEHHPGT